MSESVFTTSQATAIGRIRGLVGDRDPGSYIFTDAQIQTYIDEAGSETKAAINVAFTLRSHYARRVADLQAAPSPDNVKILSAQAVFNNLSTVIKDLQAMDGAEVELPTRRFGRLGAHASEPRRWGR